MIEILYSPRLNKFFLFSGTFKVNLDKQEVVCYIEYNGKSKPKVNTSELYHIGWL